MNTDDRCLECNWPRSSHSGYEQACPASCCAGFCPGPFCPECAGEHCKRHGYDVCDCDTVARHAVPPVSRRTA